MAVLTGIFGCGSLFESLLKADFSDACAVHVKTSARTPLESNPPSLPPYPMPIFLSTTTTVNENLFSYILNEHRYQT